MEECCRKLHNDQHLVQKDLINDMIHAANDEGGASEFSTYHHPYIGNSSACMPSGLLALV